MNLRHEFMTKSPRNGVRLFRFQCIGGDRCANDAAANGKGENLKNA